MKTLSKSAAKRIFFRECIWTQDYVSETDSYVSRPRDDWYNRSLKEGIADVRNGLVTHATLAFELRARNAPDFFGTRDSDSTDGRNRLAGYRDGVRAALRRV